MSGLVFEGDVIYSSGEYLPAPYINKMFVNETLITVENFIFIDDYNDVDLVDSDSNISNSREEYKNKVLNDLKYYILVLKDYSELAEPSAAEIFEKIANRTLNPFMFYHGDFKYTILEGPFGISVSYSILNSQFAELREIDTDSVSSKDFYDETGNRVTAYAIQTSFTIEDDETDIDHYYVFCFASTFDYFSDSSQMDEDNFNSTLFDLQIGDVSYEKVYENGELALKDALRFYDALDNLYEKIPLQAIDKTVYKIDLVTHDYIKENVEDLLSEYSAQYNSETGNDELKNIMNAIYATLESYYEDYDIIPRLDVIRKTFPDKTPVSTVGKLYKRFAKRIYNINKSITSAEQLFKRITYNSKIVDLRSIQVADPAGPSYDDSLSDGEYIYTDWKAVRFNPSDDYHVVFGHFFFDYEKALRTRTDISKVLDVNKLEEFGYHIPYENYTIDFINASRDSTEITYTSYGPFTVPAGFPHQILDMYGYYDMSSKYPYVSTVVFEASTDDSYSEKALSLADSTYVESMATTPYGDSDPTDIGGYVTSLLNRAYTPIYDDVSDIEDYRLMCYEFLEYQLKEDTSDYVVTVNLVDTTSELIPVLSESAYAAYEAIGEYYETTQEECVFNSDLGRFNEFFAEGAMAAYLGAPQTAPWFIAPVVYLMQLDLFFDTDFDGDLQKIEDEAKNITARINPVNGTKDAIEQFYTDFGDLIDKIYGTGGIISESEIPEPTTTEDTIIAVLVMPESQEMFIEVGSEDVAVTRADRTTQRYVDEITLNVGTTEQYSGGGASFVTSYSENIFDQLTHEPIEILGFVPPEGDARDQKEGMDPDQFDPDARILIYSWDDGLDAEFESGPTKIGYTYYV